MYQERLKPLTGLNSAYTIFYFIRGNVYKYFLVPKDRPGLVTEIHGQFDTIDKDMQVYRQKQLTDDEQKNLKVFDTNLKAYRQDVDFVMSSVDEGKTKRPLEMLAHGGSISNTRTAVDGAFTELTRINDKIAAQSYVESNSMFSNATNLNQAAAVVAIALSLLLGFILSGPSPFRWNAASK